MDTTDEDPALDAQAQERLERYAQLVHASPHNLMSKQGLVELATRHVPESVRFARSLPATECLLDIGSGGGLPGIIIAIVRPEIEVHLLEATGKKATFLTEVAGELGLRISVHHARAESPASVGLRRKFHAVTARAVAPLDRLVTWSEPFLAPDGVLYAIKGQRWSEELDQAKPTMESLRLEVISTPDHRPITGPEGPAVIALRRRT
jgi:16S rRNA (guanine527-N7)-methyltransferase